VTPSELELLAEAIAVRLKAQGLTLRPATEGAEPQAGAPLPIGTELYAVLDAMGVEWTSEDVATFTSWLEDRERRVLAALAAPAAGVRRQLEGA